MSVKYVVYVGSRPKLFAHVQNLYITLAAENCGSRGYAVY
jgi:hypothetical protein